MKPAIIALALLATAGLWVAFGRPVDPLGRDAQTAGTHTWRVGLGYTPVGERGSGVDAFGVPYAYTRLAHGLELSLGGTLNLHRSLKLGLDIADTTWHIVERRTCAQDTVTERRTKRDFAYTGFGETRLAPDSTLDPRLTLSLGHPRHHTVALSVNLLRDPMVLSGELGFGTHATAPNDRLTLSLAAGFVANAWIAVHSTAGWNIPLREAALPTATLGMAVAYDLDLVGGLTITVRCNLHLQGPSTVLSVKLQVTG